MAFRASHPAFLFPRLLFLALEEPSNSWVFAFLVMIDRAIWRCDCVGFSFGIQSTTWTWLGGSDLSSHIWFTVRDIKLKNILKHSVTACIICGCYTLKNCIARSHLSPPTFPQLLNLNVGLKAHNWSFSSWNSTKSGLFQQSEVVEIHAEYPEGTTWLSKTKWHIPILSFVIQYISSMWWTCVLWFQDVWGQIHDVMM